MITAEWVRTAHADAWQAIGGQRASAGGGCDQLPGVRVMATGLPHAQWNSGDVEDAARVDIVLLRRWYAEHGVPWGVRVPAGIRWVYGRRLCTLRLMGLTPDRFAPASLPADVRIRVAGPADVDAVLGVDTVAFGKRDDVQRPWLQPFLAEPTVTVALAELSGTPVGTGFCVHTRALAGPCVYVAGVAVLPAARRRGVGAAVSSWLVEQGMAVGAELAHLHPDTESAAAIYRRLGFGEVDGLDIYGSLD